MKATTFTSGYSQLARRIWFLMILNIIGIINSYAQTHKEKIKQPYSYEDLRSQFYAAHSDSLKRKEIIATAYLNESKNANDTVNIARGYYLFSILYDQPVIGKIYADSIIKITKDIQHTSFPAAGYFLKGFWCYELSEYHDALNNYLTGDSIAKNRNNVSQYIENRKMIAILKNRAGDHRGALNIYLEEIDSLEKIKQSDPLHQSDYLNRLYNASLTYMHLNKLDSAKVFSQNGLIESLNIKDSIMYYDFLYNLGIIDYLKGNIKIASTQINQALPYLDAHSQAMANYYNGQIAIKNENRNLALHYFEIADSMAESLNYTFPELRSIYEYTIQHYELDSNLENQLLFINKLLKIDSTLGLSKDLQLEIVQKYDRPLLLTRKEKIINSLEDKNKRNNFVILIFVVLSAGLFFAIFNYRKRQKIYFKKYNNLVLEINKKSTIQKSGRSDSETIPSEIYKKIASGLEKFEMQNEYLMPLTLVELAKKLDTNSTYLSKFININTGNNFSQYINKLRIQYIVERLKSDSRLRSFTIEAIAEEIGFGTPQSFSKAFYNETGIFPSYYIKKLNNN